MVDLLGTLFSSYVELHAFTLGVGHGLLVAALWRHHRHLALALVGVAIAAVYWTPPTGAWVVSAKPWYFLAPVATMAAIGHGRTTLDDGVTVD